MTMMMMIVMSAYVLINISSFGIELYIMQIDASSPINLTGSVLYATQWSACVAHIIVSGFSDLDFDMVKR